MKIIEKNEYLAKGKYLCKTIGILQSPTKKRNCSLCIKTWFTSLSVRDLQRPAEVFPCSPIKCKMCDQK